MNQITRQVSRARRRLNLEQFLRFTCWTMFACLLTAAVSYAVRRYWWQASSDELWYFVAAGTALGLLSGGLITFACRRQPLEAALEIDRRFRLKERISSSLALNEQERDTEAGQALLADAARRVERIDVTEQFKIRTGPQAALPLVAAVVFALTVFVPNISEEKAEAAAAKQRILEQIRKPAEKLKKKIKERQKQAAEKGLADASELLKKVGSDLDKITKDDVEKKEAMMRINDIAKELEKRRKELGSSADMKKQLAKLKDIKSGPADKAAKAMESGDFKAAMEAMEDLKDKIADDKLSDAEKQDLAQQLEQMRDKMEQMQAEHEQKKRDLQEQIRQRRDAGDLAGAEKLQQQLDALREQDSMMNQMAQMASQLGQAAENMKSGDPQLAAENLDDLLDQIQDMQQALDELQELGDLMDDLGDARQMMAMQGMYGPQGNMPGMGLGDGQGQGERPEEEGDTGAYSSKVRGDLQKGAAVRVGTADGPNRKGVTREEIKDEIKMSISERAEAINTQQRLPRDQREHLREYFRLFNEQ